jgi:hypothetical protein
LRLTGISIFGCSDREADPLPYAVRFPVLGTTGEYNVGLQPTRVCILCRLAYTTVSSQAGAMNTSSVADVRPGMLTGACPWVFRSPLSRHCHSLLFLLQQGCPGRLGTRRCFVFVGFAHMPVGISYLANGYTNIYQARQARMALYWSMTQGILRAFGVDLGSAECLECLRTLKLASLATRDGASHSLHIVPLYGTESAGKNRSKGRLFWAFEGQST